MRALYSRRGRLALAVVVLVVAAVVGVLWLQTDRSGRREADSRSALTAATNAAQVIFSYDYRSFDAGVAKAKPYLTGAFAKEYADTTASLKTTATQEQAVVQAQVSAASVVEAAGDHVDLLLYLNQYRRNTNIDGEKVDQNRVVLTLVRVGGQWKVSAASAI
jgi:Mce-associated membrane protein